METLTLAGLVKRYGGVAVVDGLDLTLRAGEFLSLLGPSGCGKTTTLRMVAGFVEPSAGTIAVDGRVLSSASGAVAPEHRGMSMIFQSYAIWPNMTVFENVAFGLRARGLAGAEVRGRVGEMLDVVRLAALAQRYPSELSGGQQQRVALARAIVVRPDVLLLDEPLSNLDANLREEMRGEIRRLHDAFRTTSIYVTHDQAEAMATSDRIAVMNEGRIEQVADPVTLYTRPRTRFVAGFVGRTNLVQGRRLDDRVEFDGFTVPLAALPSHGTAAPVGDLFSLRPGAIGLAAPDAPTSPPALAVPGTVRARVFLGEVWDYSVAVGAGTMLRVTAPPEADFAPDGPVRLAIDPARMVPVA